MHFYEYLQLQRVEALPTQYPENGNNLIDQNTFFLMVHLIQYFYVAMSQNFVSKERGGYTKNDSMFTDLK